VRAQCIEHAEVLTAQVSPIRGHIEAIDDQDAAILGKSSACGRHSRVTRGLQTEIFVRREFRIAP
jgi:hypothetical protein